MGTTNTGVRRIVRALGIGIAAAALLAAPGCRKEGGPQRLVLATTTSVRDCGLLDALAAEFTKETGITVAPIAVGSGEAMRMGRDGNADVLLVHDPAGERKLLDDGIACEDRELMRSRFLVVGPASDPAGIRGLSDAAEVFRRLAEGKAPFVSRGDDSGTHRLEKRLWEAAGAAPAGDWYVSTGSGMIQTLRVANEKQGYCLVDLATALKARGEAELETLVDSDDVAWANLYSVLLLCPAKFPSLHHDAARRFADFLSTGAGRGLIESFGRAEHGRPVFELPPAAAPAP